MYGSGSKLGYQRNHAVMFNISNHQPVGSIIWIDTFQASAPSGKASAPLVLAAFTAAVRSLKVWNAVWASIGRWYVGVTGGAKEVPEIISLCANIPIYKKGRFNMCMMCVCVQIYMYNVYTSIYIYTYRCLYMYIWTRFRNAMRSHACICTGAHPFWLLAHIWGIPNLYIYNQWFEDKSNTCSPDLHDRLEKSSGTSVSKGLRDISKIAWYYSWTKSFTAQDGRYPTSVLFFPSGIGSYSASLSLKGGGIQWVLRHFSALPEPCHSGCRDPFATACCQGKHPATCRTCPLTKAATIVKPNKIQHSFPHWC